mmetsp:Transcript_15742/g.44133  ORF Transcript_15742/g.44133 Transcript_15742/m.44133 type:complete len:211 (-) Transcript_15742:6169-6801(-)
MESGSFPNSAFPDRSNSRNFASFPTSVGTDPAKLLPASCSSSRLTRLPISVDSEPTKCESVKSSSVSSVMVYSVVGKVDPKYLLLRRCNFFNDGACSMPLRSSTFVSSRYNSSRSGDSSIAMKPMSISFLRRLSFRKAGRWKMIDGITPFRLLSSRSIVATVMAPLGPNGSQVMPCHSQNETWSFLQLFLFVQLSPPVTSYSSERMRKSS